MYYNIVKFGINVVYIDVDLHATDFDSYYNDMATEDSCLSRVETYLENPPSLTCARLGH